MLDAHELVLAGLSKLIEERYDLVGAVSDVGRLLASARKLRPDVILLDIAMPKMNGIPVAPKLREMVPGAKVVFVTVHDERGFVEAAMEVGAAGYVLKSSPPEELMRAIEEVHEGRRYISSQIRNTLEDEDLRIPLTKRQREILALIATGLTSKEIGEKLFVSTKDVGFHKTRIRQALKIKSTAGLTRYAIKHGIVPP